MPTLADIPPIRTHTVIVVVVIVVDIAGRRNAKEKYNTQPKIIYFRSFVLHAIAIYFTSETIFDQYPAELSFSKFNCIDNSM